MRTPRRETCSDCGEWRFCTLSMGPRERLCDDCIEARRAWEAAHPQ